jgi:hypothetical protein
MQTTRECQLYAIVVALLTGQTRHPVDSMSCRLALASWNSYTECDESGGQIRAN